MSTIIGIDNGSSGSLGIIRDGVAVHYGPIPTQPYLHYGKKGSVSQRLDRLSLGVLLRQHAPHTSVPAGEDPDTGKTLYVEAADFRNIRVFIERPFSGKFINAVVPAHRFFEATIIVLEDLGLGYEVIDSGVWQKPVLGNVKGSAELKLASKLRGIQIYPQFTAAITKQGDADGLLISHFFSRQP
jgi:hypothetical protein